MNATVPARNIAWKNWRTVGEAHIGITMQYSLLLYSSFHLSSSSFSVSSNIFTLPSSHFLSPRKMSENFQRHLEALEMEAKQTLQSLLSAPMQRITKLPLLMKEIQKRAPNDHRSHEHMKSCHKAVEKVFMHIQSKTVHISTLTLGELGVQFYCMVYGLCFAFRLLVCAIKVLARLEIWCTWIAYGRSSTLTNSSSVDQKQASYYNGSERWPQHIVKLWDLKIMLTVNYVCKQQTYLQ